MSLPFFSCSCFFEVILARFYKASSRFLSPFHFLTRGAKVFLFSSSALLCAQLSTSPFSHQQSPLHTDLTFWLLRFPQNRIARSWYESVVKVKELREVGC